MGNGDAAFAGLQVSRNGESLLARDMERGRGSRGRIRRAAWWCGSEAGTTVEPRRHYRRSGLGRRPARWRTDAQPQKRCRRRCWQQAREAEVQRELDQRAEEAVREMARSGDRPAGGADVAVRDVVRIWSG